MSEDTNSQLLFGYSDSEEELTRMLQDGKAKQSGQGKSSRSSWYLDNTSNARRYRGYTLIDGKTDMMEVKQCSGAPRQVWYVMTGNGCQWHTMGRNLMHIPLFRRSVEKCHNALQKYGFDLYSKFMEADPEWINQGNDFFMAVAAIQIALTDVLKAIGVRPDGIIGHSFGENTCPYPDECATLEETMECAYRLVKCVDKITIPFGLMAVVGASWREANRLCNKEVQASCNNSIDSVTVAGKTEAVNKFIKDAKKKGFRAMPLLKAPVPHNPLAAQYLAQMGLQESLEEVISPRPRTKKWLSTSYDEKDWDKEEAKNWSGHYVYNNFLKPVRFYEMLQKIPKDAIVIEVSPNALFRTAVKQTLSSEGTFVSLIQKENLEAHQYLMQSLGTLFLNGIDIKPDALFQE